MKILMTVLLSFVAATLVGCAAPRKRPLPVRLPPKKVVVPASVAAVTQPQVVVVEKVVAVPASEPVPKDTRIAIVELVADSVANAKSDWLTLCYVMMRRRPHDVRYSDCRDLIGTEKQWRDQAKAQGRDALRGLR